MDKGLDEVVSEIEEEISQQTDKEIKEVDEEKTE